MSYARWSNSAWYAFYNVNGALSLWYSIDKTIDWEYDAVVDILALDAPERNLSLMEIYACSEAEAVEAETYMKRYVEDYDPADGEAYEKEVNEMLAKWEAMDAGWVCSKCGVDRTKDACPKGHTAAITGECPMIAEAQ